jgi:quercetin dioxygenase-like cupin family protein
MRPTRTAQTLLVAVTSLVLGAFTNHAITPAHAGKVESPKTKQPSAAGARVLVDPFTVRATLDPFFINQAPEIMIRSHVRSDVVIQRLVTAPGPGAWHTHPGPQLAIVEQGQVMITRLTRDGCTSAVYGAGEAYLEVAGQVHRATVLGAESAVEHKVRFNTPIGGPFSTPADDPGC